MFHPSQYLQLQTHPLKTPKKKSNLRKTDNNVTWCGTPQASPSTTHLCDHKKNSVSLSRKPCAKEGTSIDINENSEKRGYDEIKIMGNNEKHDSSPK